MKLGVRVLMLSRKIWSKMIKHIYNSVQFIKIRKNNHGMVSKYHQIILKSLQRKQF